ncbi:aldehyde dehydrogenase family protein [Enterovibrio nigricans]|uniref:Acyl-CoA reductase n=1 Tax=Enterovibrio nigricans DSM 22720 TaxID=1121868 RepID=A0A1T4UUK4_9GAMM|nr:aldehyde dehydrogenase family protein [Enterovibrio nigricans]PKF49776.1 aldehyde dehydrogenase [Enterovibrio nigricans]SKA56316.1 Acyl-CoA reductase [Enterovibrio nigricans DSM 22720]
MSELNVYRPYDGGLIRSVLMQSEADVESALATAHSLFLDRSAWMPPHRRIEILERTIEIMSSQVEALTQLAAEEGGKPYIDSKVEVLRAINGVKLAIVHIPQIKGEQIPMGQTAASVNRLAFTIREPIGVVSSISAFNHPLNLIVHQVIPAIAVGCPVIIKPALTTPLSCLRLVEILHEAGLPKGWCQAVVCENDAASKLVSDARVNFLSFIGSANVGWMLRSQLAPGTRCALEHGGAAPVIVDSSAHIDEIAPVLAKGGFYHAGQVCVSVQRIYAQQGFCRELAVKLAAEGEKMTVGDPLDPNTEVGPLILPREVDRVEEWVKQAVDAGAEVLCGGKRLSETCFAPTVLLNPPEDALVSQREIFGPVICVYSYADKQDAIDRANGLPFAFQASVFTNDLEDALNVTQQLNATAVMVNDHTAFRVDWMPFGGRDASGIGLGGIQYSMHEMTRDKMLVFKSPSL